MQEMLSTEQFEYVNTAAQDSLPVKRMIEPQKLPLRATYYPLGFPADVATNSIEILEQFAVLWGAFRKRQDTAPIRCEALLVEEALGECPAAAEYRLMLPFAMSVADANNYCIADLERGKATISVSRSALRDPHFVRYFLLGMSTCCITSCYATPVHSGCVSLNGRGILLCGDSGAGKSTLAYACARAGFTYVNDDSTYILDGGTAREVAGNCHQVRLRPAATALFPELSECKTTMRAAGKPSIELPTAPMANIACAQTARVDFIVFLNRHSPGPAKLLPFDRKSATEWMHQVPFGPVESLARQYASIENLLKTEILELHYSDLDSAIHSLRLLASG